MSLRWMNGDKRKVKTDLCGGCKTIELNKRLVGLVNELFRMKRVLFKEKSNKKVEPKVVHKSFVQKRERRECVPHASRGERESTATEEDQDVV